MSLTPALKPEGKFENSTHTLSKIHHVTPIERLKTETNI